jgi:hypothetical protein
VGLHDHRRNTHPSRSDPGEPVRAPDSRVAQSGVDAETFANPNSTSKSDPNPDSNPKSASKSDPNPLA